MLKTIQNQLNLIYLNTDEHTHLDRYTGNTDILDMALTSPNLSKHDIQFLIGDDLGSDHLPIEIAIDTQPHRNIHINPVRYKFYQTDREVFESTLEAALSTEMFPSLSLPRILDNYEYFYPPEDPDDYRSDVDDDHDLVADIDSDTLIKIVKFLKRGKAPGPDNIHNEVLRLGTTTSLFHHLARLFTSSIQIGYIPTAWKLATLRMLLKPDKLPSLTTSYRPISLMSSIMKLFERVIEQRLRSYLEDIGFIKYQSGFRQNKSTDDHLFRLSQSVMESFNRGEQSGCFS